MVNSRWLKTKEFIFSLFFLFSLVSCNSQQDLAESTEIPFETFTPIVTATPFSFDPLGPQTDPLKWLVWEHLDLDSNCTLTEILRQSQLHPLFVEENTAINTEKEFVAEIADSSKGTYRAYIIQEYDCETCNRLTVDNKRNGTAYQISWNILSSDAPTKLYDMIWVEDKTLLIRQSQSDKYYLVAGINMNTQQFDHVSEISCK